MALWEEEDYGVIADQACWTMFAITAVIVGLRIFCRMRYAGAGIGMDDYITCGCLLVFLLTCILITEGSRHGLGRHMATLDPESIPLALKYNVIISAVLIWTFSLPKFAIISVLKRILNYGTKTTVVFWGLALSSQACILATSVWWFEQCSPVEYGWNRTIPGSCADISVLANLGYFTSAYSAFLDIFFALYPIPFIMRLNMPFRSRVAVSVALGFSAMASVVSIYKLAIFDQVFTILAVDPTYPVPYLDILGVAEGFVLIVCSSLPTLGPLFRAVKGKVGSSSSNPTNDGSHNQLEGGIARSQPSSRNWDNFKGHKLEDGEHSTLDLRPSFDAMPLVTTGKRSAQRNDTDVSGIHKTMEVSVSSESFEYKKSQKASSAV